MIDTDYQRNISKIRAVIGIPALSRRLKIHYGYYARKRAHG